MGQPWAGPEPRAGQTRRPAEVRPGGRKPLLRPASGISLRPLLHGLERVEPRAVPLPAVQPADAQAGRAQDLCGHLPRGVRRDQGREPACPGGHRRDVSPRPRPLPRTERRAGDGVAGPLRKAPLRAEAEAEVRRLVTPPVPDDPEAEADPAGALAERDAPAPAPLRRRARQVVQAGHGPDLDHRVRLPDETGHAGRGDEWAAGRLSAAGTRLRGGRPERAGVHLVHPPRRPDERMEERPRQPQRREETRLRDVHQAGSRVRRPRAGDHARPRHAVSTRPFRGARALVALRNRREGRPHGDGLQPGDEPAAQAGPDGTALVEDRIRRVDLVPRPAGEGDREGLQRQHPGSRHPRQQSRSFGVPACDAPEERR